MSNIFSYSPLWDKWEIVSEIGSGLYGTVYKIKTEENGKTVFGVAKHIEVNVEPNLTEKTKDNNIIENINSEDDDKTELSPLEKALNERLEEIQTNYSFSSSKNLLIYEEHSVYEKDDGSGYDIFIRMPYYKSLSNILNNGNITDDEKIKLGIDVCNALTDLENQNVLHGDIKPENIFKDNKGNFLLADFGIEKRPENIVNKNAVTQNVNFMAPELQENKIQKKTSDIYSLGLLLYKLFNNNNEPFLNEKSTPEEKNEAIIKRIKGVPFPAPIEADDELSKIILIACQFSPEARWMNAASFKNALLGYSSKKADSSPAVAGAGAIAGNIVSKNTNDIINNDSDNILSPNDIDAFDSENDEYDSTLSQETKVFDSISESQENKTGFKDESDYDNFTDPEFDFDENEKKNKSGKGKFVLIISIIIIILALLGGGIYYAVSTNMFGGGTSTADQTKTTVSETKATSKIVETQPSSNASTTAKPTEKETEEPSKSSVSVPYIVGMDYSRAMDELAYVGLYASIESYEYSDDYQENTIISVDPSEGSTLNLGDTVSVIVSQGPIPQEETERDTTPASSNTPSSSTEKTGGYVLEGSDSRIIEKSEISSMDDRMLTLAVNEIYARHGYIYHSVSVRIL